LPFIEHSPSPLFVNSLRLAVYRLYDKYPQPRAFEEDEDLYRVSGYVIETPEVYIMGKAVKHDAPIECILHPGVCFAPSVCDAWFLHAMAGDIRAMYSAMPYFLPLVGWARRDGQVHFHSVKNARNHISNLVPMFVYRLTTRAA
jgi:hypothetical protein